MPNKRFDIPSACTNLSTVTDYLAPVLSAITETHLPEFLRSTSRKYMVIGSRAVNVYLAKPVLTGDWDLVVLTTGNHANQMRQVIEFAGELQDYLIQKLKPMMAKPIIETKEIIVSEAGAGAGARATGILGAAPTEFIFSLSLPDPYLNVATSFLDLHNCHPSSISNIGDYCNYLSQAITISGIRYAPKTILDIELKATLASREKKYRKMASISVGSIEREGTSEEETRLEKEIDDNLDRLEMEFDMMLKGARKQSGSSPFKYSKDKIKSWISTVEKVREDYETLTDLLKSSIDQQMLLASDYVKYQRTLDRQNRLM